MLYYQDTLYEVLERTGFLTNIEEYNKKSPISKGKQTLLKELNILNFERLRQEDEMKRTYIKPDDKKTIKRLEDFVKNFHEAFVEVDFISVFESYQEVVCQKEDTIENLTNQLATLGVLDTEKLEYLKSNGTEQTKEV